MKHTFDTRTGLSAETLTWHRDANMEALVVNLLAKTEPDVWYETGTYYGWTTAWLALRYPKLEIATVEIDAEYYRLSGDNLDGYSNVKRTLGDSRAWLWRHVEYLKKHPELLPVFWLDAHFGPDHPLAEECTAIAQLPRYIVLIDDYHCGPDFPGDPASPAMVKPSLGADFWRPSYTYRIGFSGYGLWLKNVDYPPPSTMRRA